MAARHPIDGAVVFVAFGAGKFVNHGSELASFRQYALPAPDAFVYAVGVVEIVGVGSSRRGGSWRRRR